MWASVCGAFPVPVLFFTARGSAFSENVSCKITIFWTLTFKFHICCVIFSHNRILWKLFIQLVMDTFVISKGFMSPELLICLNYLGGFHVWDINDLLNLFNYLLSVNFHSAYAMSSPANFFSLVGYLGIFVNLQFEIQRPASASRPTNPESEFGGQFWPSPSR